MRVKGRSNLWKPKPKPKPKPVHNSLTYDIPDGFVLVQDTREQLPLFSRPPKGLTITTNTLPIGDYSIQGFESSIAIERKQLSDLISFIGKERARTIDKLNRMRELDFAALVIEAEEIELLHTLDQTLREDLGLYSAEQVQIKSSHIRGFLISCNIRYGIHTYLTRNRDDIARWVIDRLIKYYNYKRKGIIGV